MSRTRIAAASALLVAAIAVGGCAAAPAPDAGEVRAEGVEMRTVSLSQASALGDVVAAMNRIGTIGLAHSAREENAVVSPLSLAVALAMLTEGARGDSLRELEAALGASGEARRDAYAALQAVLRAHEGDPAAATADTLPERPLVHRANRVVVHEGFEVLPEYLVALADGFDAGVRYTDLSSADAKRVLSEWIDHHTGGLIKESAIEPRADLRLVLQDVILLAAKWQKPFPPGAIDQPFTLQDGSVVQTPTMFSNGPDFAYAEVAGWRAVRLPYVEALHADVLLPPVGADPAEITPELLASVTAALDGASTTPLLLTLPKLDIGPVKLDLLASGTFEALGIGSLICGRAGTDLSGIALQPGELCVDQAMQQAVLKVDEEGTVAAAVTEIGVSESSAPMIDREIRFDRPFLFTVSHTETGLPLFQAAIRDPRH